MERLFLYVLALTHTCERPRVYICVCVCLYFYVLAFRVSYLKLSLHFNYPRSIEVFTLQEYPPLPDAVMLPWQLEY